MSLLSKFVLARLVFIAGIFVASVAPAFQDQLKVPEIPKAFLDIDDSGDNTTLPLNKIISLNVQLKGVPRDFVLQEFKAEMPEHRHGMILQPKLVRLSPFRYRIEGVKFHMRGKWTLTFVGSAAAKKIVIEKQYHLRATP